MFRALTDLRSHPQADAFAQSKGRTASFASITDGACPAPAAGEARPRARARARAPPRSRPARPPARARAPARPAAPAAFPLLRPGGEEKDKDAVAKGQERLWQLMSAYLASDKASIQRSIVDAVEYRLAGSRANFDEHKCYLATAYSCVGRAAAGRAAPRARRAGRRGGPQRPCRCHAGPRALKL